MKYDKKRRSLDTTGNKRRKKGHLHSAVTSMIMSLKFYKVQLINTLFDCFCQSVRKSNLLVQITQLTDAYHRTCTQTPKPKSIKSCIRSLENEVRA